jgi:hypothetical protein
MADWTDEVLRRSFDAAKQRGREAAQMPHAKTARYDRTYKRIIVELDNGCAFAFPAHHVQGLEQATVSQLADIELLGDGYALRWPQVNADIRVEGVLAGIYGSKAWMMRLAAQEAGKRSTERKAAAARANGLKGGRPRKAA